MADPTPPHKGVGPIVQQIANLQRQIDALASPSGTQRFQSVRKLAETIETLQLLVDDIQQQLTDFIANDVQAIVDARISIALASYFGGNVSIGGSLFVNGTVQVPGARATPLGSAPDRVAAWIAGDGRLGHTA